MKKLTMLMVVVLLLVSTASWAQATGNDLHAGWQSWQRIELRTAEQADLLVGGMYVGFVRGVEEMLRDNGSVDVPKDVNQTQVYAIVGKYLDDHPEQWDGPSEFLVMLALDEAWPGSGISMFDRLKAK